MLVAVEIQYTGATKKKKSRTTHFLQHLQTQIDLILHIEAKNENIKSLSFFISGLMSSVRHIKSDRVTNLIGNCIDIFNTFGSLERV